MASENKYFIFDNERKNSALGIVKNCIFRVQGCFYNLIVRIRHPQFEKKKYSVAICAIFKNEAQYLEEWIEYHLLIGVEHFYLYNNNSSDDFRGILSKYIEDGIVTLVEWPQNQAQMQAYNDCIEKNGSQTNWIGFIDIDEFIVPRKKDSIADVLDEYKIFPAIVFYWKLFGTSGRMDRQREGLVTEDFTVCWNKLDEVGKCFFNTSYSFVSEYKRNKTLHHYLWAQYKGLYYPPFNIDGYSIPRKNINKIKSPDVDVQINHYFTKSYNEYLEKKSKGDVYFEINPHDEEYFFKHEMRCLSTDYSIYKYLVKLKKRMNK